MRQDPVNGLRPCSRHGLMRLRELLDICEAGDQGIQIDLAETCRQHMQDNLGILRIILVPSVVDGFALASECHGRDQACLDAGIDQSPGQCPMIITGCLKPRNNRTVESLQPLNKAVVLCALVEHNKTPPSRRPRHLYQNIIALLGNVDRDEHSILCDRMNPGHGRSAPLRWWLE